MNNDILGVTKTTSHFLLTPAEPTSCAHSGSAPLHMRSEVYKQKLLCFSGGADLTMVGGMGHCPLGLDYLMGVNEGLQGLCVIRKCSPKAKCLLCFRKPLQQHVDCVPKLFCLK